MPLSGFMAPVTLVGSLVQHTAETLSGVVISQLASPGAPVLYGGSPAIFDVRYETTPMGAVETMMIDCAYSEIGKHLGLPTQAYIALSDAKLLDAQAGLETGMGATLAALSGINSVSGPGMLDFESCQSLEKLVLDNEICGMTLRLVRGIEPREDFPALPLFEELLREKHLLIAKHTRRYLRSEIVFPGPVIDRANRARWQEEGGLTLGAARAARGGAAGRGLAAVAARRTTSSASWSRRMTDEARATGWTRCRSAAHEAGSFAWSALAEIGRPSARRSCACRACPPDAACRRASRRCSRRRSPPTSRRPRRAPCSARSRARSSREVYRGRGAQRARDAARGHLRRGASAWRCSRRPSGAAVTARIRDLFGAQRAGAGRHARRGRLGRGRPARRRCSAPRYLGAGRRRRVRTATRVLALQPGLLRLARQRPAGAVRRSSSPGRSASRSTRAA